MTFNTDQEPSRRVVNGFVFPYRTKQSRASVTDIVQRCLKINSPFRKSRVNRIVEISSEEEKPTRASSVTKYFVVLVVCNSICQSTQEIFVLV